VVQEGGEKGGLEAVHRLPHRGWHVVRARGGGVRGLGKGPGYLLGGKGGIVLVAFEAERWVGWGLGREEVVKERLCYLGLVRGPGQVREPLWRATKKEPLGCPEGVWSGRGQEVRPVCFLGGGDSLKICSR